MSEHHPIAGLEFGTGKKTLKTYLSGFVLCLLLTFVPFALVAKHLIQDQFVMYGSLLVLAIIQLYVQVVFFLRLNTSAKGRWHLTTFLFTIIVILVLLVGSIWIMHSLDYNMAM